MILNILVPGVVSVKTSFEGKKVAMSFRLEYIVSTNLVWANIVKTLPTNETYRQKFTILYINVSNSNINNEISHLFLDAAQRTAVISISVTLLLLIAQRQEANIKFKCKSKLTN